MSEPTTAAGRDFIERFGHASPGAAYRDAIAAIESEARAQERERLRPLVDVAREIWELWPTWYFSEAMLVRLEAAFALLDDPK